MSLPYVDGIIEATIDINNTLFLEDKGTGQGEVALSDLKFVQGNTRRFQYDADDIDLSFTNSLSDFGNSNIHFNISDGTDGTDVSYIDVSFATSGTYYLRDANASGATNNFTITVYQYLHELQNSWLSEIDNTSYNKFHTTCIKGRMDLSRGDLNIRGNLLALDNNSEDFIYYESQNGGWVPILKNNSTPGVNTDTDVSMSRTRAIFEPKPAYSYGLSQIGATYEPFPDVNYQSARHHVYGLSGDEHMIMSYDESTTFLNPVVWKYSISSSSSSWIHDAEIDVFSSDISDCDVTLQNCTMSYDSNFVAATYRALNGSSLTNGYYMDVFGKHSGSSDTDKYTKMRIYIGGYVNGWDVFFTLGQQAISGNIDSNGSNGSTDYRRILFRRVSENRELQTELVYKDISFNASNSTFGSMDVSGVVYPFNRYGTALNGMYNSGDNARLSLREGTYAYISEDGETILTRTLMRSAYQGTIGSDYSFFNVNETDSNNNLNLIEQFSFTNDEAGEYGYRYQRESQLSPDGKYAIIGVDVYKKSDGTWVGSKKDNRIPGTNVVLDTGVAAPHVDNSTTVITNNGFRVFVYNVPDSKIYIYQKSSGSDLEYSLHDTIDYSGTMGSSNSKGLDLVTGEYFTQHDHIAGLHQTGTVSLYRLDASSKSNPTFDMHVYTHDELRIKIHDSSGNPQTEFRFDYDGFYAPVKNFEIKHPLRTNYKLRHTSVETPQVATMYSGNCQLVDGRIEINIDNKFNMTNGTFSALNVEPFVFTSNESEYDEVKGYVEDGVLIIECENTSSNASVSWIIFGKRNDDTIQNSKLTDGSGNYITEIPLLTF